MSHSDRISECRAVVRTQLLHDSTHSGWERRNFCSACTSGCWARFGDAGSDVDVHLIGGPSGTAHPSDSCVVVFTEIDADLESQLEIVSEVPGESIGFSSDGRLPTHSIFGPHCCMGREMQRSRGKLCGVPPCAAEEEQAGLSLPVAKARRAKNAAKRSAPSGIVRSVNAKPNLLAGWPSSKSVELLPFQHRAV